MAFKHKKKEERKFSIKKEGDLLIKVYDAFSPERSYTKKVGIGEALSTGPSRDRQQYKVMDI